MKVYNVDFINPSDFSIIHHTNTSEFAYSDDYLSPDQNRITIIANNKVQIEQYIYIYKGSEKFFGIVALVSDESNNQMTVDFVSFLYAKFNYPILFNTNNQGSGTLENALKTIIQNYWVSNSDSLQNVVGMSVQTTSSTSGWGFNLKSDTEGQHHLICNFFDTFIVRSLEKYGVKIDVELNLQARTIVLKIGTNQNAFQYIEADLKSVITKNVIIKKGNNAVNKLVVWNTEGYNQSRIYYRHSDDSYSTANTDRLSPVVFDVRGAEAGEGTFASAADNVAGEVFGSISYDNYIEVEVLSNDTLVNPEQMLIGQKCYIISEKKIYTSILTGKKSDGNSMTLIFGTVRVDLTKILKKGIR